MGLFGRAFHNTRGSSPEPAEACPESQQMDDHLRANLHLPLRSADKGREAPDLPSSTFRLSGMTPGLGRLASSASRNGAQSRQGSVGVGGTARQGPNPATLWGNPQLELHELTDLYEEIHRTFSLCRYAIAGVDALIDAGFSGRTANNVMVVCPEECKDVTRGWAMTASGVGTGGAAGADSVSLRIRDGSLRRVRVSWLARDGIASPDTVAMTDEARSEVGATAADALPPPPARQFSVGRRSTELSRRSVDMVMGRGTPPTWL